jgi:hypothetical protein
VAWPDSALDILVEVYVPTIGWVDFSSRVRRDGGNGVHITDGMTGVEQRRAAPSMAEFQLGNLDGHLSPRNPAGPYYGLLTINAECRITIEGAQQFWGEIESGWPTEWTSGADPAGQGDAWVPVIARGRSARINADDTPLAGPLADLLTAGVGVDYYWPLTDPASATYAAPMMSDSATFTRPNLYAWGVSTPTFAGTEGPPSSKPTPDFSNRGGLSAGLTDGISGDFYVGLWFKLESGDTSDFGAMSLYQLRLDSPIGNVTGFDVVMYAGLGIGTDGINRAGFTCSAYTGYPQGSANRSADMQIDVSSVPCTQDDWHFLRVVYTASGGAITQTLYLDGVLIGSDTGSAGGYTLGAFSNITLAANDSSGLFTAPWTANSGVGLRSLAHLVIQTGVIGDIGIYEAGMGYPGETAGARMARICGFAGVAITFDGDETLTSTMTAQRAGGTLSSVLESCAQADGGLLADDRTALGLHYVTRIYLYNNIPALALDYTLKGELQPALKMDESSFTVVNDLTATSPVGEIRVQQLTGPRNVTEPSDGTGGVGRYPGRLDADLDTVSQLTDAANWALRLSTADVPRFTAINVNLRALAEAGKTSLWQDAAAVMTGGLITITNTPVWIPDDVMCFAVGRSLRAANLEYDIAYNTIDATAWANIGGPLEDSTYGRLDSEDTYLHGLHDSAVTTLYTHNAGGEVTPTLWTHADGDYHLRVDDEELNVTAVSTVTPSFVAAGTAAHADNASVTPGMPAGAQRGDLLIVYAAIRATSATAGTPAGYGVLFAAGHIAAFYKIHTGTESAPTVTFAGGAAGDTTSAQIAALRGVYPTILAGPTSQSNGAAQNIAYPSIIYTGGPMAILWFGWKQDDWTSVAAFETEIGDTSSALGNDQGLVWNFSYQSFTTGLPGSSWVVTGGAAAISEAYVVALDGRVEQFTVTRAADSTTAAAHAHDAQVRLAHPLILGR